jgi:hypothetical protein
VLVSLFSRPDPSLLSLSMNTLWSCEYQDDHALKFIDVKMIQAVVAIIPHRPAIDGRPPSQCFFLVEKLGLDVAVMAGAGEDMLAEELNERPRT